MNPFIDDASLWDWEKFKPDYIVPALKIRTDKLNEECTTLQGNIDKMEISHNTDILALKSGSTTLKSDLTTLYDKLTDMQTVLNAILLKETSVITEEELRTIYKMLTSPDKENKVVAEEAISNKIKEI